MSNQVDAQFLEPFLVDTDLLDRNLYAQVGKTTTISGVSEFAIQTLQILHLMEKNPAKVTPQMYADLVTSKETDASGRNYSQIGRAKEHIRHCINTAQIAADISDVLRPKGVAVSDQETVYGRGIGHDLSAVFDRYDKANGFAQEGKELILYFLARHHGATQVAEKVALHGAYLNFLEKIAKGGSLPPDRDTHFDAMRAALNNQDHDLAYTRIILENLPYLQGTDNADLIVLSTADFIDVPEDTQYNQDTDLVPTTVPGFNQLTIASDFRARVGEIKERIYDTPRSGGQPLTLNAIALFEKGATGRLHGYMRTISDLTRADGSKLEGYQATHPQLFTQQN